MPSKRKLSTSSPQTMADRGHRPVTPAHEARIESMAKAVRGFFHRIAGSNTPDLTNPVINGTTTPETPFLTRLVADIESQKDRLGADAGLLSSLAHTTLLDGGIVDDRKYQLEEIVQLAASLPVGSKALDDLTGQFIGVLWNNLRHPPLSLEGKDYKYRTADGSNNNIMYPHLGKAGSSYARTVTPQTLQPGVLPDPGVIFDSIFARGEEAREHPNKISSMLFYLATIIIHDCFHTDERDQSKVKTSSYLDLAPLYGSSKEELAKIRTFKDGLLKPDTFCENRILGFPPGVSALVVCFNRYHNYIAMQLKEINEGGRFKIPTSDKDVKTATALDEDLFQTARLVTCGLYINIVLIDYVRTILNLNRSKSTWSLDPRKNFNNVFDPNGTPLGIGNQVSVEFNLVYRWHSAISKKDEKWSEDLYRKIFPQAHSLGDLTEEQLIRGLQGWIISLGDDPSKWTLDNGKYQRNERGSFRDEDLINILSDATEDVACAFGPRNVPVVMKLVEVLGMKQARAWNVATLNEFRKFFKLTPYKSFSEITKNEEVAHALRTLYKEPDYVELYPGLVAEDGKDPRDPGSGLCPGYTISRTILADAVTLTRGDRFYTVDYSPANLTNWGWNQVKSDTDVASGGVFYNLVMRALPFWYRGNSVYAMYPFTVPNENRVILKGLGKDQDYNFDRPSYVGLPTVVKTWKGITSVLQDQARFAVPWGPHTFYLTGHDFMLSGDTPENSKQHKSVSDAIYCPTNGLEQIREFYEDLTTQLIEARSERLRGDWRQLDACSDVANPSHAIFTARMFDLPLKAPGEILPIIGVEVDQLYLAFSVLFAYVFLDLDTARSFKLRAGAKAANDQIAKLIELVSKVDKVGDTLGVSRLWEMIAGSGTLRDYGQHLLSRLMASGKSPSEITWAIIPTMSGAVATQAQHLTQMLDLYLSDEYKKHWPDIQACAWSNDPADFEKLKKYALEANRLAPAAFGSLRISRMTTAIEDGDRAINVKSDEQIYTDFISGGLDEKVFPHPREIDITRDRSLYIHHGWGPHACIGRGIVEVSMAAQLKVFAKLKNLRRAPGPQGVMKKTVPLPNPVSSDPKPNPGSIEVFLKEDYSDWWPFPTSLKIHHDGFCSSQAESLKGDTGAPNIHAEIRSNQIENGDIVMGDDGKTA